MLEILGLTFAIIHFTIPITYYIYMKKYIDKPWNIKINENYKPYITVILPTYNEAKIIRDRLNNIYEQDYPKELFELIIIDSSSDNTLEIIEEWIKQHSDLTLKLIKEEARRGKAYALNHALNYVNGEIVVIADADAFWPSYAITKVVKWLSDLSIGAVSCLKKPLGSGATGIEEGYRQYYNVLRIAESKKYATPIFHGELAAFKTNLLREIGGFPTDIGADDSYTATKIALKGFRAIVPEDIWVEEKIPDKGYLSWKIRRAQHLIQHFTKILKVKEMPNEFKRILLMEGYLHIVNPWLFTLATTIFLVSILLYYNLITIVVLVIGLLLVIFKPYRIWITTQLCLILGEIRNLHSKEIVWTKHNK